MEQKRKEDEEKKKKMEEDKKKAAAAASASAAQSDVAEEEKEKKTSRSRSAVYSKPGQGDSPSAAASKKMMPKDACDRLKANDPALIDVDLSGNTLFQMKSLEYTNYIAESIKTNTHIRTLTLRECGISDTGAQKLGLALTTNKSLVELNLAKNKIGSDGVMALAVGLSKNSTLKTLNLQSQEGKRFGEAALACIVKMFDTNITLTNIMWRLDSKQAWAITKRITRNLEIERRLKEGQSIDDLDPRNVGNQEGGAEARAQESEKF